MSSTSRGGERNISDYYFTPEEPIRDFLLKWVELEHFPDPRHTAALDPCAGGDAKTEMSYPKVLRECGGFQHILTVDIRQDSRADIKQDYLELPILAPVNLIITNPPFALAREIITKALEDVTEGGYVAMLLRLNFFGSLQRKAWFQTNMPLYTFVHSKRIRFHGASGTDSIEYCHMVWKRGHHPASTQLFII